MAIKHLLTATFSAALLLSCGGAAIAQTQPQYTVDDVAKSFADPNAGVTAPATPGSGKVGGTCEAKGKVTGPDGLCYSSNQATAGFNLGRRNATGAAAKPAATMARASRPSQPAPRTALQKDLLITFKLGSADLTDQGRANAEVFAKALKVVPLLADAKFQLAGYTDSSGSSDKNAALAQRRAEAVKAFLIGLGIDGSRLTAKGYGAQDFLPGVPTTSPNNRRVVASKE
jgi:outer membrane protein OmpA-like peptidoglycan-associated protein